MSFTKGVSFHHETNASSQPNITNNISINASNELTQSNPSVIVESANNSKVQEVQTQSIETNNENAFLKKVLNLYMNQRFYFSGKYIVLTPDELLDLIQTLLPGKGVVIRTNDIDDVVGCCSFKDVPIKKIESIWVNDNESEQNFKYVYSNLVALLESYRISIKFIRVQ